MGDAGARREPAAGPGAAVPVDTAHEGAVAEEQPDHRRGQGRAEEDEEPRIHHPGRRGDQPFDHRHARPQQDHGGDADKA